MPDHGPLVHLADSVAVHLAFCLRNQIPLGYGHHVGQPQHGADFFRRVYAHEVVDDAQGQGPAQMR